MGRASPNADEPIQRWASFPFRMDRDPPVNRKD